MISGNNFWSPPKKIVRQLRYPSKASSNHCYNKDEHEGECTHREADPVRLRERLGSLEGPAIKGTRNRERFEQTAQGGNNVGAFCHSHCDRVGAPESVADSEAAAEGEQDEPDEPRGEHLEGGAAQAEQHVRVDAEEPAFAACTGVQDMHIFKLTYFST